MAVALALLPAAAVGAVAAPPAAAAPDPYRVYVSPDGNDGWLGATSATPVRTLSRAQSVAQHKRAGRPVEILLAGGEYRWPTTTWYLHTGYPTVVAASGQGGRPVLSGAGADGFALVVRPTQAGVDMQLTIRGVTVTDRQNGIQVSQARGVTFDDVTWLRIGGRWTASHRTGYGALHVNGSDYVRVEDSRFGQVENARASDRQQIHAVYAVDGSDRLTVTRTSFTKVSGDAIRVRDSSDNATVTASTFTSAGVTGALSDWYGGGEKQSVGGRLEYSGGTAYSGGALRATYCFDVERACPTARISLL